MTDDSSNITFLVDYKLEDIWRLSIDAASPDDAKSAVRSLLDDAGGAIEDSEHISFNGEVVKVRPAPQRSYAVRLITRGHLTGEVVAASSAAAEAEAFRIWREVSPHPFEMDNHELIHVEVEEVRS